MQESIWRAGVRALVKGVCLFAGFGVGMVILAEMVGAIADQDKGISSYYDLEVMPNVKGERKELAKTAPVLLVANVEGLIGTERLNMQTFHQMLVEAREGVLNKRVKGVLLRINSMGGTVTDSDAIYRMVGAFKEQMGVPVVAYVEGVCASGGYYVACAADRIVASDTAIVGSIGVVSPPFMNVTKLMEKVGVESETFSKGKGKDSLNPFRPWGPDEGKNFDDILAFHYDNFVSIVTDKRKVEREKLVDDWGAKVFPAPQALEMGLIDAMGSFADAQKALLAELAIDDDYYQVVQLQRNWISQLLQTQSTLWQGKVQHEWKWPNQLDSKLENQFLYLMP
ncbi:MAG: S49 family peptidase [Chlamydiia bacterium]|nr:S49 family peptidase [Chlamydiia bacterium]